MHASTFGRRRLTDRSTTAGLLLLMVMAALIHPVLAQEDADFTIRRESGAIVIRAGDRTVASYQLEPRSDTGLSVASACYFHPLTAPSGTVLTEVAPADHPHHRGVFLAFVEMHGARDADFWGWGEPAPKENRVIANREVTDMTAAGATAGFRAVNEWLADGARVLTEELRASARAVPGAHVLDLEYALTPDADLTLSRWAFSGFCVRTRKDGTLTARGPKGTIDLPNPSHLRPETDWPASPWYAYELSLPGNKTAGVAVIDHPANPPALWHNHRDVRMLNPCIVAPGQMELKKGEPLRLRYRVLAFDGSLDERLVRRQASDWRRARGLSP